MGADGTRPTSVQRHCPKARAGQERIEGRRGGGRPDAKFPERIAPTIVPWLAAVTSSSVRLGYVFADPEQRGAELDHPLFEMLAAMRDGGSIARAARALGYSYRHVWGGLHAWEAGRSNCRALVVPVAGGIAARASPSSATALRNGHGPRRQLQPHIEALREQLRRIVELRAREQHRQHLVASAPVRPQHHRPGCAVECAEVRHGPGPRACAFQGQRRQRAVAQRRTLPRRRFSRAGDDGRRAGLRRRAEAAAQARLAQADRLLLACRRD